MNYLSTADRSLAPDWFYCRTWISKKLTPLNSDVFCRLNAELDRKQAPIVGIVACTMVAWECMGFMLGSSGMQIGLFKAESNMMLLFTQQLYWLPRFKITCIYEWFFLQDSQLGVFQSRPTAVTVVLRKTPILYKSSHCMVLMPGQRGWKPAI